MPRALVNFEILNGTISAKPVNDSQELLIAIDLPVQFAYRMISINVALLQDVANNWDAFASVEITNAVRGLQAGNTQQWSMASDRLHDRSPGGGADPGEMFISRFAHGGMPTDILQSRDGVASVIVYVATNSNVDVGAAGTVNFLATFLEFDIEQAQRFPLHWPFMTYARA